MGTSYLSQVSIFGSLLALVLILAANWAATLIHVLQEWKGEDVPLWRVFGAIAGLCIPHPLGFALFTLALIAALWLAGVAGIAGWFGLRAGIFALGFVIGARISDSVVSHWVPYATGFRPNPGLSSTVLYVIEAGFLIATFFKGLAAHPVATSLGIAAGAALFIAVIPGLRLVRRWVPPAYRRDPWVRQQPIPAWAREPDCRGRGA